MSNMFGIAVICIITVVVVLILRRNKNTAVYEDNLMRLLSDMSFQPSALFCVQLVSRQDELSLLGKEEFEKILTFLLDNADAKTLYRIKKDFKVDMSYNPLLVQRAFALATTTKEKVRAIEEYEFRVGYIFVDNSLYSLLVEDVLDGASSIDDFILVMQCKTRHVEGTSSFALQNVVLARVVECAESTKDCLHYLTNVPMRFQSEETLIHKGISLSTSGKDILELYPYFRQYPELTQKAISKFKQVATPEDGSAIASCPKGDIFRVTFRQKMLSSTT